MVVYFKRLKLAPFFTFQEELNKAITLRGTADWNIPAAKVEELDAQCQAYAPLYNAIKKRNNRTPVQVWAHTDGREKLEKYIEGFANQFLIGNMLISTADLNALGFNRRSKVRKERGKIELEVMAKLEALSSSRMQFICRTESDENRPSIPKDADSVQVAYSIGTEPKTANDCTNREFSTRAKFILQLEPETAGQRLYAFTRWYNFSNPKKSGPWSDMLSTIIRS